MRISLLMMLTGLMIAAGCSSQPSAAQSTATVRGATRDIDQQVAKALAEADAAIARSNQVAQATAGIDSRVPGQPRLSDAEQYRRQSLDARAKAHDYAHMSNKCSFLAANVEEEDEKAYWRGYAAKFAAKSNKLHELSREYTKLSRRAAR